MSDEEDYAVHREGMADAAEPDAWTKVSAWFAEQLGAEQGANLATPVPYVLTPQGEVAAAEPDTWTRYEASPTPAALLREWAGQEPDAAVPFRLAPEGERAPAPDYDPRSYDAKQAWRPAHPEMSEVSRHTGPGPISTLRRWMDLDAEPESGS